jgi:uroporphyrinogen decarboxylase
MDLALFKRKYINNFTVMGGLDVQSTIGFGKYDFLKSEIERILTMFKDGGMIFMTSHAIQPHCTIDELVFAYDLIYEMVRKIG